MRPLKVIPYNTMAKKKKKTHMIQFKKHAKELNRHFSKEDI